ncbi:hypothetical protein GLE_2336 [Lysobacter enzymogenes]|uniref:Uncharacterized protein n=1 Tax=Lysobacter enzymogenes TaxID=69 RepID=A0A0S2DGJ2_LYSEN|nr:hypothetical protein GLE_2336 [Lysobacter enzymogenes]
MRGQQPALRELAVTPPAEASARRAGERNGAAGRPPFF